MVFELSIITNANNGKVEAILVPKQVSVNCFQLADMEKEPQPTLVGHMETIEKIYNRIKEVVSAYNNEKK